MTTSDVPMYLKKYIETTNKVIKDKTIPQKHAPYLKDHHMKKVEKQKCMPSCYVKWINGQPN
jgi:hypothetical protein